MFAATLVSVWTWRVHAGEQVVVQNIEEYSVERILIRIIEEYYISD